MQNSDKVQQNSNKYNLKICFIVKHKHLALPTECNHITMEGHFSAIIQCRHAGYFCHRLRRYNTQQAHLIRAERLNALTRLNLSECHRTLHCALLCRTDEGACTCFVNTQQVTAFAEMCICWQHYTEQHVSINRYSAVTEHMTGS